MEKEPSYMHNTRKCNTLWVGDLEPEVDEKYLSSVFGQSYNIKSIHIYKDKITNGKVNYAFLEFDTPDIAEKVLNYFNGKEKPRYGKPFKINWGNQKSRQNRPMFGNRPMYNHGQQFQPMPRGFNPRMPPGMMHGMMGMRGMYPNMPMNPGMFPPMMPPHPKNNFVKKPNKNPSVLSIYVGDLDTFCEQENLVEFFKSKYKSVVGGKIIKDFTTKKNKGYGFVHFDDPVEAEAAIKEMNGKMFMGRRIRTGKSFSKSQMMRTQNHRNHMFNMMNRGMHPMQMPMNMRGPMMPYPRHPMMGRPGVDQNHQKNAPYMKGRGQMYNHSKAQGGHPHKSNSRAVDHYRKVSRKSSYEKKPNYMISSNQERSNERKSGYESRRQQKLKEKTEKIREKKRDYQMDLKIVDDPRKSIPKESLERKERKRLPEPPKLEAKAENKEKPVEKLAKEEKRKVGKLGADEGKLERSSERKEAPGGFLNKRSSMDVDEPKRPL